MVGKGFECEEPPASNKRGRAFASLWNGDDWSSDVSGEDWCDVSKRQIIGCSNLIVVVPPCTCTRNVVRRESCTDPAKLRLG